MARLLGCTLDVSALKPYFKSEGRKILVFYDPCHMVKLKGLTWLRQLMLTELPESEIDNNLKTLTSKVNTNEHIGASGIGFRDVKYALEPSEGHFGSDANEWLANFENVATASCWNDVQKYLFARRLLQKNCKSGSRIGMKCIILVLFSKI